MTYATPISPTKPQSTATTVISFQGAHTTAESNSTAPKVDDGWRREAEAGMRITAGERYVVDEGHHNELQSDQSARRRADDYVEVMPSAQFCHVVDQPPLWPAQRPGGCRRSDYGWQDRLRRLACRQPIEAKSKFQVQSTAPAYGGRPGGTGRGDRAGAVTRRADRQGEHNSRDRMLRRRHCSPTSLLSSPRIADSKPAPRPRPPALVAGKRRR